MSVAVISTCYNQADLIGDAVESVINQTVPGVYHIIADDGSTDSSPTVLRQWEVAHDHITVIQCTNRNPAGAFNAALLNVPPDATFIVTLCGDDWLAPNFVEECLAAFHDNLDVVIPGIRRVGSPDFDEGLRLVPQHQPTVEEVWAWNPPRMWTTAMFRKAALLETGGFHTAALGEEDWDMWIDLTIRGRRFGFTNKTWFYYRYIPGGLTDVKTREEWDAHRREIMRHHKRDTLPGPEFG